MTTLDDIHRKVRAILERANHPETPPAEAETALAMAYRLMLKYDLDMARVSAANTHEVGSPKIERRRYETTGPYRVRRSNLRFRIGSVLSCASYRDRIEGNLDTVVSYYFGTPSDLDAVETLYAAAELLALRTIPWGDRGFRTSWWHGFADGIEEKLSLERRQMERDNHGVALVLRDRENLATLEMERLVPGLRANRLGGATWESAYSDGHRAGSTFTGGSRSVGGVMGSLPRGR